MEEKILFKEQNKAIKESLIFSLILMIILSLIGFLGFNFFAMGEGISMAYWIKNWLFEFSLFLGGVIFVCFIIFILGANKKIKVIVTENNIYGKKGRKNFDIYFKDIIEIKKKGKNLIIETEDTEIKLSSLEKCDEIYNYIKPFVPVIELKQIDIKNILD